MKIDKIVIFTNCQKKIMSNPKIFRRNVCHSLCSMHDFCQLRTVGTVIQLSYLITTRTFFNRSWSINTENTLRAMILMINKMMIANVLGLPVLMRKPLRAHAENGNQPVPFTVATAGDRGTAHPYILGIQITPNILKLSSVDLLLLPVKLRSLVNTSEKML